ncbi:MAG: zinc ribbon domain-containing protein [Frisingicoccus sp.]
MIQNLLERDTRRSANGIALLSGLVECADCGQSMVRKSPDNKHFYYVCSTHLYEKACSTHSFSEKKLIVAVKESVRYYISLLADMNEVLQYVQKASIPEKKMYEADLQLEMLKQEMQRILRIKKNLYESFCDHILDEEEFRTYKTKYDKQLEDIEEAVQKQQAEIGNIAETLEKQRQWMKYFLEYQDVEEIDHTMLVMLVKRIRIHEGKRVSIDFWFADEFERMLSLLQTANQVQPDEKLELFLNRGGVQHAQSK